MSLEKQEELTTFYASAIAFGYAYTLNGDKVTSSSSATATSTLSYENALNIAQENANSIATSVAQNEANIINQTINIIESEINNSQNILLKYFNNINDLNNYKLPTPIPTDPQFYNIITNINNFEKVAGGVVYSPSNRINPQVNAQVWDYSKNYLYIGGLFSNALQSNELTSIYVNNIAKWDGINWSALGDGLTNLSPSASNPPVNAIVIDKSGNLYAGGNFSSSGLVSLNNIAKWNGSNWLPLGNGLNGTVYALALDNLGYLYAGGDFTTTYDGNTNLYYIAKWNGTSWLPLSSGLNERVNTLIIDKLGNVYTGGRFTTTYDGNTNLNYIAKWNGTGWFSLGGGVNAEVNSLSLDNSSNLYLGGYFSKVTQTNGSQLTSNYFAKWNGIIWLNISFRSFSNNIVTILYNSNIDKLYLGGYIEDASVGDLNYIVNYNYDYYTPCSPALDGNVYSLSYDTNNNIYCGVGAFQGSTRCVVSNQVINGIFKINILQLINNDGTPLILDQIIYAGQKKQSNTLIYNNSLGKWEVSY